MAKIYYVSMVGKNVPTMCFQITKAYPTWLGCKRVLNRLCRSYPSAHFQMEYVTCELHEVKRFLRSYICPYDFDKAFRLLYETDYRFDFRLEGSILSQGNV